MTRLRDLSSLFEAMFDNSPIGMSLLDLQWRRVKVNRALCDLLGRTESELIGRAMSEVVHPDDIELGADNRERLRRGEVNSFQIEKRYRHASGQPIWALVTVSAIRDGRGRPICYTSQALNISDRKSREDRLEQLVDHDFLTGLYNRRYFERALGAEIDRARRYGHRGALLLVDLDHFKRVNDLLGHAAGDQVLKSVAATLKHHLRGTDVLARLGGDEFAILLPETSERQAALMADGVVRALRRPRGADGEQVTGSVGVTFLDAVTPEQALENADQAMYEAKNSGRDKFVVASHAVASPEPTRSPLGDLGHVHESFADKQLCLYGQPIVDLVTGQTTQYELLLRVHGPGGGDFPPALFLASAERAGQILSVDAWVVREAVRLLAKAPATVPLTFNVNVSGPSIGSPGFAALVEGLLDRTSVDPSRLVFEITETTAISDIEQAKKFARRMRELGCQIALDDFGSGFGSFQYLKYLPFDVLKIDGEFVRELTVGTTDQVVVKAIVGISREMRKKTVAEFIESHAMAELLRESGVNCGQGFYLGLPRPVEHLM